MLVAVGPDGKRPGHFPGRLVFTKHDIENGVQGLPPWSPRSLEQFVATVRDLDFPCPFARQAQAQDSLYYAFCDSASTPAGRAHLLVACREYLIELSSLTDTAALMAVLVAIFRPQERKLPLDAYRREAWALLQWLHLHDPVPWPADVPTDPAAPTWTFCLYGTPLFVNVNTPAYRRRHSRNLGDGLVLVVQPRDAFDHIAGDTSRGRRLRQAIRARINAYDDIAASPHLGTYGHALESAQYAPDDANGPAPKCPFVHRGR